MRSDKSMRLSARAMQLIPGGVNSPVRAWKAVGGSPRFIARARGCHVTDVDGNEYIDYIGSWGPMILGHAHPAVQDAVAKALRDGTSFGAPTEREVEMAREIVDAVPSMDMIRLVNSGTEATMTALRVARGFTGRQKILKFAGCYHGHSDALLVRAGSGAMTFGVPDSAGVTTGVAGDTLVAEFNDLDGVRRHFKNHGPEIAAVIVEPVVGNMGVVRPRPGFLSGLREVTAESGALLVFDEVMTGFRVSYAGVQGLTTVRPDLTCLGKVIGGGLPLAAVGGRREVMLSLAPEGPVYQAGTLSGNPLAVAAGLATLAEVRRPGSYERLEALGTRLQSGLEDALRLSGVRGCINRQGSMWTLFFGVDEVHDLAGAQAGDTEQFGRFFLAMLEHGIYLPPSAFEAAFISLAHGDAEIDTTVSAAKSALAQLSG